MQHAKKFVMV